jgi:hypothetical protein
MRKQKLSLILLAALALSGAAHATLIERLGGAAYYDDVLDITWLADANLAASNTFGLTQSARLFPAAGEVGSTGRMNWDTANAWIAGMNAADHLGFDDWRLPSAFNQDGTGPCGAFNCNSSEMGYMFYDNFGVSAFSSVTTSTDPDFALFDDAVLLGASLIGVAAARRRAQRSGASVL